MESKKRINDGVGKELDFVADKIDHKEIHGMFGIDADTMLEQDHKSTNHLGSFGQIFHGDTANAWRYTAGMLPGKGQRYLNHDDVADREDDATDNDDLSDLQLPPER